MKVKVSISCSVISDSVWLHGLYSLSGSSVHGISQARILEWVTIFSSRKSSNPEIEPGTAALLADSLPTEPPRCMCACTHTHTHVERERERKRERERERHGYRLLSVSWRPRKKCGMIHSESENQGSQCSKSQSKGKRRWNVPVHLTFCFCHVL